MQQLLENVGDRVKMGGIEQHIEELMILLAEECGELTQACMKIKRHGLEPSRVTALIEEVGDVQCLIDLLISHEIITFEEIYSRVDVKTAKLREWSSLYD